MSLEKKCPVRHFTVTERSRKAGFASADRADRLIKAAVTQIKSVKNLTGNRLSHFFYNLDNITYQVFGIDRGIPVHIQQLAQYCLLRNGCLRDMPVIFRIQNRRISVFSKNFSNKPFDCLIRYFIKNRLQALPDTVCHTITVIQNKRVCMKTPFIIIYGKCFPHTLNDVIRCKIVPYMMMYK